MPVKKYLEPIKKIINERQMLREQNELQDFFLHCPKAQYQFSPIFHFYFAKFLYFDTPEKTPKDYILLGTGRTQKNKNNDYLTSGDFALVLDANADKLKGNVFRISNHLVCEGNVLRFYNRIICEPKPSKYLIDKDTNKIGHIVKLGFSSDIHPTETDSVFVRARRLAGVVEKFKHSDATIEELKLLQIVYDNAYYIIMQEILRQSRNANKAFKHNVNKAFAEDFKNDLPLNEFIEKWETWSEAYKTLLADYDGKTLLEQLQRQQEHERQRAEQRKRKQKELYDHLKL